MQFYYKRDFSAFISDTFLFFKENGKNYFKNYLLINGLLLILLVVIFVLGYREIFSQIVGSNIGGQNYLFEQYFAQNQMMLILISIIFFILFIAVTMISYSYPVLYLKRLSETGEKNIKTDEMLSDLKQNIGKFLKLFLGLIFIVTPLAMVFLGISVVLIFLFIGLFFLLFAGPAIINIVNFLMFDYFHTKKRFLDSLKYAFRAQFSYIDGRGKSPFWKYWGSTVVMYFIIQTISSAIMIVPMIILMSSIYTIPDAGSTAQNPFEGTTGIVFFVFYGISIVFSFLMMNLILVNSGLQYYDSRIDLHRNADILEIDTIGRDEI